MLPRIHPEWGGTRGSGAVGTCCPAPPFLGSPAQRFSVSTHFADIFYFPSRLHSQTDCLVYLPRASTSLYKIDVCAYRMYTEAENNPRLASVHQSAPFPVKPKMVQPGGQRGPSEACKGANTAQGEVEGRDPHLPHPPATNKRHEGMESKHLRTDRVNKQKKANMLSAANNSKRRKQRGNYHCSAALWAGHGLPVCFG